jgi:hypothetical protein
VAAPLSELAQQGGVIPDVGKAMRAKGPNRRREEYAWRHRPIGQDTADEATRTAADVFSTFIVRHQHTDPAVMPNQIEDTSIVVA